MKKRLSTIGFVLVLTCLSGCAEGPLWKTGTYIPWVREKWDAEEQVADTLYERKRELSSLVRTAVAGSESDQNAAAERLAEIVQRDPVLLIRLHAVQLLGQLDSTRAVEALQLASKDPDSRVRIAAINGWTNMPDAIASAQLQEIVGADTDVDVRLVATKALGTVADESAIGALGLALTDSNPAIQLRATQSLEKLTGQKLGPDVAAWQAFIQKQSNRTAASNLDASDIR